MSVHLQYQALLVLFLVKKKKETQYRIVEIIQGFIHGSTCHMSHPFSILLTVALEAPEYTELRGFGGPWDHRGPEHTTSYTIAFNISLVGQELLRVAPLELLSIVW